jgi:hypothetical protein
MKTTKMDLNSNKNQEIKRKLVSNEVYYSISQLVNDICKEDYSLFDEMENYEPIDENGKPSEDGEYPEIFEFWLVSDWFADKLAKKGECVNKDWHGLTVWGRCTTGQHMLLDSVVSHIAKDMEILEGQLNEWNV